MDETERRGNLLGTTIIDVDIGGAGNNTDLPGWLRDVLDRALDVTGLRQPKKHASKEAIKNLEVVPSSELTNKECPICYDPYEDPHTGGTIGEPVPSTSSDTKVDKCQLINQQNSKIIETLGKKYGVIQIQPMEMGSRFNDPSMFLPVDEVGLIHSRYPQRNLSTMENPTTEHSFPGYENEFKEQDDSDLLVDSHIPVKMPCNHVFGKSCLYAWLKNEVSCPLCRRELPASGEKDSKAERITAIRDESFFNFNDNREANISHLINDSTDIFNPYRRPFNPSVTPLTDSFMHQDWASPYGQDSILSPQTRDPHLVLPKKFPFPESGFQPLSFPRRNRVRDLRRDVRRMGNDNEGDRGHTDTRESTGNDGNRETDTNRETTNDISERTNDVSSGTNSPGTGTGGPERSRRFNIVNGRSHPYFRPSSDES